MSFAFVFSGQGSQSVGMLKTLASENYHVEDTFMEASDVLNYNLWELVQKGPSTELNKTWRTQPALLASSVSIYRIWKSHKMDLPVLMAGHSLGEYSALVCANVLNFSDAIKLVEFRGHIMQEAVAQGEGLMQVIIGLDYKSICKICKVNSKEGHIVTPANLNSPNQIVISGNIQAVELVGKICKNLGAKYVINLPISVPSHCELMRPISIKLAEKLDSITFSKPSIPVINNVDVKCETDAPAIRQALVRQLYSPVRWIDIIKFIASKRVKNIFEIGPGKVLTNLNKCIVNDLYATAINDPISLMCALKR